MKRNWIVVVYNKEEKPIGRWEILDRTEREANKEAESDIKREFPDFHDYTVTEKN
jgi:hypothetical protein